MVSWGIKAERVKVGQIIRNLGDLCWIAVAFILVIFLFCAGAFDSEPM